MTAIGIADKATLDLVKTVVDASLLYIGDNEDAADPAGSLHAKLTEIITSLPKILSDEIYRRTISGNTLRFSKDNEVSRNDKTP